MSCPATEVVTFSVGGFPFSTSLSGRGQSLFKRLIGFLDVGASLVALFYSASSLERDFPALRTLLKLRYMVTSQYPTTSHSLGFASSLLG